MNMQPKNQKTNVSPRAFAQAKYNTARMNLILVVAFTAINIILTALQTGTYLLFSASVPFYVTERGLALYIETASIPVLIIFALIAVVLTVPYIVCWKLSEKHHGWMIGALVYFAIDTALLLLSLDLTMILDLLFHAWVFYYLIIGIKYGKQLKTLPEDTPAGEADYTASTETSDFANTFEDFNNNTDSNDQNKQ